jgi:Fe-S cluster biogenesis protein NfuA/nitrite reductase/ring-hydroxylating ferredoxin subunit
MAAAATQRDQGELLLDLQDLQAQLDAAGDSPTRRVADELLATIMGLYGEGLQRIVATLMEAGEEGERLAAELAADELVASLLMIHDVHPVPLAQRVHDALERVRPYMESHGGNVELLRLEHGVATLKLQGSCSDCAASAMTLELAIKQALEETAPDLEGLEVEGVAPESSGTPLPMASAPTAASGKAIQLPMATSTPAPRPAPAWFEADHLDLVPPGKMVAVNLGDAELVVANVDGTLLAYANSCANCGAPLDGGALDGGTLACPRCARTYFLPSAGRSLDDERLQLVPFPLLRDHGHVKVALTP